MDDEDVFSPEEQAFFSSGGKADPGAAYQPSSVPAPAAEPAPAAADPAKTTATEEGEPGEVLIDETGRVRDGKSGRWIPVQVLQREREQVKTLKQVVKEHETWRKQVEEKLLRALDRNGQPAAPAAAPQKTEPEALINPREDLIAAIEQRDKLYSEGFKKQEETQKQFRERIELEAQQRRIEQSMTRAAQSETTHDIRDAFAHLATARAQELSHFSMFRNPDGTTNAEKIAAQLNDEMLEIARDAEASKRDVASMFYELAKLKGYTTKQRAAADAKKEAPPQQQQKPTPAEEAVDRIARGQAASRTLGNSGAASSALTIDEFLAMDDGEVAQRLNTDAKFKAQVDALFGRRS